MSENPSENRDLICANRLCSFLVHTNPAFGGYCCKVCHWASAQRLACLVHGNHCEGCEVLDPGLAPVKRAPTHWTPQCPLPRGWASPTGVWLASQALTRSDTEQAAQAVHQSTETIGVADASGGLIKVDVGGGPATGSVALVVLP